MRNDSSGFAEIITRSMYDGSGALYLQEVAGT